MSLGVERQTRIIALIGNPNTGKSSLFGTLSGVPQRVGNYPGVTVEKTLGEFRHEGRVYTLVDLPGTYSLAPRSPDEMVAVDVLLGRVEGLPAPDLILCLVAADKLERCLYLASQLLELGRPVVVGLTMLDVAMSQGLTVDVDRLARQLGVPVVPLQPHRGLGVEALKGVLAREPAGGPPPPETPFPEPFRAEVDRLGAFLGGASGGDDDVSGAGLPRYLVERLLLDSGGYVERKVPFGRDRAELVEELRGARQRLAEAGCPVPAVEAQARYAWAARAMEGVVSHPPEPVTTWGDRLDAILTHRVWGTVVLAAVLFLTFNAVFAWAQVPMDWIDAGIAALGDAVGSALPEGAIRSLITDGIIAGIGAVVIFLPQIMILFLILTALEECGYLARAAYLMDRLMARVGLSGKSFIPLLSSFACAIPAVMATRVIEDRRDRLTTILIAPLMSCSARLPVYTLMIAAFIPDKGYLGGLVRLQGLTMFGMYAVGVLVAASAAAVLKKTLLRGSAPHFLMELPAYKRPSPRVILHRIIDRSGDFLRNAGTVIFAVSIVMWAALYYPRASTEDLAPFEARKASLEAELATAGSDPAKAEGLKGEIEEVEHRAEGVQQRQSFLGRAGRLIEPAVRPLGWDWRIGSAVIASFPAREVVVATIGVIFDVGGEVEVEGTEGGGRLGGALHSATWPDGRPLFNVPVALSIMVFFALCAQCVSTLAVIARESGSWGWAALSFGYMTVLAYVGAFLTYQAGTWLIG